jgi:hypothetical protein
VATALVVAQGDDLLLAPPAPAAARRFRGANGPGPTAPKFPSDLRAALSEITGSTGLRAGDERLQRAMSEALGRPIVLASVSELRTVRRALTAPRFADLRTSALRRAHLALEAALRSPEEMLITLTREEERLERAVGREERAGESFLAIEGSPLAAYERLWFDVRASLRKHHASLESLVRAQARAVVPNLSAVVGERTAARLVSIAGGVQPLSRMRAGRIQLLGTRRRPSPERGPRYGLLYRAEGMERVPPGRRGAYARSLGALAAIAVRADATTRSSIAPGLVARRDRRIARLRGSRA